MCGIVGIVGAPEPIEARTVAAMRDRLAHRGPDDSGLAFTRDGRTAFGHRRLAILDPSPAGHQPMWNRAHTLVATYNGEIYNFRELGAELTRAGYAFTTRSDTEVLLAAFEHWGLDAVERLRGMFAFAIWSEETRECALVRDRLGVKPLYYAVLDGVLYFASEATALLAAPACPRDLDLAALGDYLAYGYVPGERSIWRGIRKLPPAHLLVWTGSEVIVRRYWEPPAGPDPRVMADPAALRAELEEAVKLVMVSDVPVGAFLSGGLDSSTVVALMSGASGTGEPVHSYTIDFDGPGRDGPGGHSDAACARMVAERYATDHHERHLTLAGSLEVLGRVVASYDEPIADESAIPTFLIAEEVARDVKVVVSGDGGDEIFAGYRWYEKLDRIERMRARLGPLAGPLARLARRLPPGRPSIDRLAHRLTLLGGPTLDNYFRILGFFDGARRAALLDPALAGAIEDDALWLFRAHWRPELPLVRRLQLLDLHTYLPDDILVKVDRASMRHSLETRVPLLDHRLVEHALRLPLEAVYRDGEGKQLLRAVARDLLPEPILSRPKQGFGLPRASWERDGLGALQAERLRGGVLVRRGLVRPQAIEKLLAHPAGRDPVRVWQLFVLDLWLEAHELG
jgi:asparagine synthase (glutamine-hydrolysing)